MDRHGDALLVVPSVGAGQAERTAELLQLHRHTPDPTGRRRLRHAAWVLTEAEPEEVPAFALVVGTGTALRVLVHGGLTVTVHGPAEQSFSAADALTWLERTHRRAVRPGDGGRGAGRGRDRPGGRAVRPRGGHRARAAA